VSEANVERELGTSEEVELYANYFSGECAIIQYLVECGQGRVGVEVICAKDSARAPTEHCRAEKHGRLRRL